MNLYDVLRIPKGANSQQIREAYKTLVKTEHPDKGGDAERFKAVQKAYDVLKDDEKKAYYDRTGQILGEQGSDGSQPHGGMPFGFGGMNGMHGMPHGIPVDIGNLFGMFGASGPGGGPRKKRPGKAPPRVSYIPLTLKDYYQGRLFRIQLERQKFCKDCKGDGSTSMKSCSGCKGSGQRVQMVQMGPFMMQNQGICDMCGGHGKQKGDNCWTCKGQGVTKEEKSLDVRIEAGSIAGNTIVFPGESSDSHDYAESGDVVIELQAADEDIPWTRVGDDLYATVTISYSESLLGTRIRLLSHPGYDVGVSFSIPPGVLNTETLQFTGYGMPKKGSGGSVKGNAVITVHVSKPSEHERMCLQQSADALRGLFAPVERESQQSDHIVV
jgi:DnaJ-class molecular chaperone